MLYKRAGLVMMRLVAICSLFILTACSPQKPQGAGDYLLPWANQDGEFHLQEVAITTLNSSSQVSGSAAKVYVEPVFDERGLSGPVARPRVVESNGVKVPLDILSSIALAAYANMERIHNFERRVLGKTQLSWPRQVAIETQMVDSITGKPEVNNARYYGDQDAIAVFPYGGSQLPMAVNTAILAHEHFHAHFHKAVIVEVTPPRHKAKDVSQMDFSSPFDYNSMVVRAWNEGVADFYATVYTKAPSMLAASMGSLKGHDSRTVDGEFSGLMSSENFKTQLARGQRDNLERRADWCKSTICAYRQGTQLARWLYQFSGKQQQKVLAQVVTNLPKLGTIAKSAMSARFMELDEAMVILVQDIPLTFERCQRLHATVSTESFRERFGACSNLQ